MSVKDVEEIRQKVFYIDRYVNPFLNNQIMQINANLSQLIQKVKELDNKVNSLNLDNSNNEESTVKNEKVNKVSKDKIPKKSNTNDIRTISLQ
tara:strand:+ start:93 stop:371 length:279 start_codon:yes stop_codon:yes gene_type:complete